MALKISLKPGEKFVVNGAVITNGDRRASLIIQNRVSILREKDILQASDANTPARRIYFPIMLMYLDDETSSQYYDEFVERMTEFMGALENPQVKTLCLSISRDVMTGNFYRALMTCKKLFEYEKERLQYVPDGVYEGSANHRHAS
jgi:flagellar biosynthesis repressor protein FlbT